MCYFRHCKTQHSQAPHLTHSPSKAADMTGRNVGPVTDGPPPLVAAPTRYRRCMLIKFDTPQRSAQRRKRVPAAVIVAAKRKVLTVMNNETSRMSSL